MLWACGKQVGQLAFPSLDDLAAAALYCLDEPHGKYPPG